MGYVPVLRAAELLGCSDDTIYRRAKLGQVESTRDMLGRLLIEIPGEPDVPHVPLREIGTFDIASVPQGVIPQAVHLHNLLQERSDHLRACENHLRAAEIDAAHLRALNLELLAMLRKAMRAPRQTRRLRTLLTSPPS